MTNLPADSTVIATLDELSSVNAEEVPAVYRRLVASVWEAGTLTAEAAAAVPAVIDALSSVERGRRGYLVILLGLIVEARNCDEALADTIRGSLDRYLELLVERPLDDGLTLALLYLLAHFPQDRERILGAAAGLGLDPDDGSRLDRVLKAFDPRDTKALLRLGRSFPSPATLPVTDEELAEIGSWAQWNGVPADRVPGHWAGETRVLTAYSGAKALWTVERGPVAETPSYTPPPEVPGAESTPVALAALGGHQGLVRCTKCHEELALGESSAECSGCGGRFPVRDGCLDLLGVPEDLPDPLVTRFHRQYTRPAFMRLVGGNWGGELSYEAENRMIPHHVSPADGPILDLGPGVGITTKHLAGVFDPKRLIALDASAAMLRRLKQRIPEAAAIRGSVLDLPFGDATVGAVNAWNFMHGFGDKSEVLAEISRVLQPGGSVTIMDLRPDPDPVFRYFQGKPGEAKTHGLFGADEMEGWLAKVGIAVSDVVYPGGNFMVMTAVRQG
jgi:SAM-dependent methyltransferase